MAVSVMTLPVFLVVVPLLTGLCFTVTLPQEERSPAVIFTAGFLVQMACFELAAACCMLTDVWYPFRRLRIVYTVCALLLCAAGILCARREQRAGRKVLQIKRPQCSRETAVYYGLFFLLLLFQAVMALRMMSFDGDDTYYVAQSLIAQQTEKMYTIVPYTGESTLLDARHALALVTMWQAFLAKTAGIHATVLAHSVMPLFLIPLSYLALYLPARELFRENEERIPVFLIIACMVRIFGNVSIYTTETFLLTRTWQGKSILANVVFALLLWVFLKLFESPLTKTYWVLLLLLNIFAGMCTSIGIFLGGGLVALLTCVLCLYRKQPRVLLYGALTLLPNVLYTVVYLILYRIGA